MVSVGKVKLRTYLLQNFIYALLRHILSKNLRGEAQPELVTACLWLLEGTLQSDLHLQALVRCNHLLSVDVCLSLSNPSHKHI